MAGRTWEPHKARQFARQARLNKPYYIVYNIAQNLAPWEDAQLYSEIVFTGHLPFTGNPCTRGGMSAVELCQNHGPVYEQPPAGMRNIATPGPQVAGPLPKEYVGVLDEAEIRGLEKRVSDMPDPKKRRWSR